MICKNKESDGKKKSGENNGMRKERTKGKFARHTVIASYCTYSTTLTTTIKDGAKLNKTSRIDLHLIFTIRRIYAEQQK